MGRKLGKNANMCRFWASWRKVQWLLSHWSDKLAKYEYCGVETGMLSQRKIARLIFKEDSATDMDGVSLRPSTDSSRPSSVDKALRSCCRNALQISILVPEEPYNKMLTKIIVASTRAGERWHSAQNKALRSTKGSQQWLLEQVDGGIMSHVGEVLSQTGNHTDLTFVGLALDPLCRKNFDDHDISREDDIADKFGLACLIFATKRTVRMLWLSRGWPVHSVAYACDGQRAADAAALFREDLEAYLALRDLPADQQSKAVREVLRRSAFLEASVLQCQEAFSAAGDGVNLDIQSHFLDKFSGMVATQACEDSFHHMKNSRLQRGKRRFRRPERCMASVLARSVLSRVHAFEDVQASASSESATERLSRRCFVPDPEASSLPLGKIVDNRPTTTWVSPNASNICLKDADLELVRYAKNAQDWTIIDRAWQGILLQAKHRIVFRRAGEPEQWFFAGHAWRDSAVVAFPAVSMQLEGSNETYYERGTALQNPVFFVVADIADIEAVSVSFRSLAWQFAQSAEASKLQPKVRAFAVAGRRPEPLLKVAAREALWSVDKASLMLFARYSGFAVSAGSSLFDTVFDLCKAQLPELDDDAILRSVCRRVSLMQSRQQWSGELAQADEAMEVLDRQGEKAMASAKSQQADLVKETEVFVKDDSAKANTVRGSAKSLAKKSKAALGSATYPRRLPTWPEHNIDMKSARGLLPTGATLWRDIRYGNFQAHYPPFPRVSRSWNKYGEKGALTLVLEDVWDSFLFEHALPRNACPVKDLFSFVPEHAVASASSSA